MLHSKSKFIHCKVYKIIIHFRYFVQITLYFNSYNNNNNIVKVKLQVEKLKSYIFNQHYHNSK